MSFSFLLSFFFPTLPAFSFLFLPLLSFYSFFSWSWSSFLNLFLILLLFKFHFCTFSIRRRGVPLLRVPVLDRLGASSTSRRRAGRAGSVFRGATSPSASRSYIVMRSIYCHTAIMSHCHTAIMSHCHTAILSYSHSVLLWHCQTVTLSLFRLPSACPVLAGVLSWGAGRSVGQPAIYLLVYWTILTLVNIRNNCFFEKSKTLYKMCFPCQASPVIGWQPPPPTPAPPPPTPSPRAPPTPPPALMAPVTPWSCYTQESALRTVLPRVGNKQTPEISHQCPCVHHVCSFGLIQCWQLTFRIVLNYKFPSE